MINSKNIKIVVLVILALFFSIELIYFIGQDKQDELIDMDGKTFEIVCSNKKFQEAVILEESKTYINIEEDEQCLSCLYNNYLLCDSIVSGSLSDNLGKIIKNEDGFPIDDEITYLFNRTKILDEIFKINDCSNSKIPSLVSEFIQFVQEAGDLSGEEKENIAKLDSEEICNLLTSEQVEDDLVDGICNTSECLGFFTKDAGKCDLIDDQFKKQGCLYIVSYMKALAYKDESYCMDIDLDSYQIICQSHFIKDNPNMCDGIINEINSACK